jgi:hypothetical protein
MLVSGVVVGLALGALIGRSWKPLLDANVRFLPVLLGSLVVRAIAPFADGFAYPLYVAALAGTVFAASANLALRGALLVALGGLLNLAVVIANGGMPVDPAAVALAGTRMPTDALHVQMVDSSVLAPLGDVIPVGIVRNVYSVGDILIAAGGFVVPFMLLSRKR